MSRIKEILSSYIEARNQFNTRNVFTVEHGPTRINRLNNVINAHAAMVVEELPTLNIAELEALTELLHSRLAHIRNIRDNRG